MSGSVLVDGSGTDEELPVSVPRRGWMVALAGVVLVVVMVLPTADRSTSVPVARPDVITPDERWTGLSMPAGRLSDVTGLMTGELVVVGEGPQIWLSESGVEWEWVSGDAVGGELSAVAAYRRGAVAVGAVDTGSAWVWHSEDGRAWNSRELVGEPPLTGVVSGAGALLAWGAETEGGGSRLLRSVDAEEWDPVPIPGRLVIETAIRRDGDWYVGGSVSGRPALYRTDDLDRWWQVYTADLEAGQAIVEVVAGDELVITLVETETGDVARYAPSADGGWRKIRALRGVPVATVDDELLAVDDDGRVWESDVDLRLDGHVVAAQGGVAVGYDDSGNGRLWVRDAEVEPEVRGTAGAGRSRAEEDE